MAHVRWPLVNGRPVIEIVLASLGATMTRKLLADTGAGSVHAPFELVLKDGDCLLCGVASSYSISLGGAYSGSFPVYLIAIAIPALGVASDFRCVGVPSTPNGLDGIACFSLLNRFTYGNFGKPGEFALET